MSAFLANALRFSRALRLAGLPVSPEQSRRFAEALELVDVGEREQVFHAARSLLVTRREHLRLFEAVFERYWRARHPLPATTGRRAAALPRPPREKPFDAVTYAAFKARLGDPEIDVGDRSATWSDLETLRQKEFSALTPEELTLVRRLIQEMRWQISQRITRRWVAADGGRLVDLHRTLRSTARHGGVPLELFWRRRKVKQRPVVLLADVSGSMESLSRLVLQFFYSVFHGLGDVECFVFGTRLSRITPQLRLKNVDRALAEAVGEVVDWAGGTRIGDCLRSFHRHFGRRVLGRGAVVVIVSDGWDRGDVTLLAREMRALQRRSHRLIWLNPLLGRATYAPRVEGMAAALPSVDDFLPVHNLASLEQLAAHLAALPARRGVPRHRSSHLSRP